MNVLLYYMYYLLYYTYSIHGVLLTYYRHDHDHNPETCILLNIYNYSLAEDSKSTASLNSSVLSAIYYLLKSPATSTVSTHFPLSSVTNLRVSISHSVGNSEGNKEDYQLFVFSWGAY